MNKVKEYLRKPGSLIMLILILLAVTITVASMIYLVIYILVNGTHIYQFGIYLHGSIIRKMYQ